MSRKKKIFYILFFLILYFLILHLMTLSEMTGGDKTTIHSLMDAFWYSVATVTTVGYGDLFPVTLPGRLLGLIFMIMSAGFLGYVISIFASKLNDKIIPYFRLHLTGRPNWYIFISAEKNSLYLADSILKNDKKALVIFCTARKKVDLGQFIDIKAVFAEMSLNTILKYKKKEYKCRIFSMGEDGYVNYQNALACHDKNIDIYCESQMHIDSNPSNVHIFNKYSCLARHMWSQHPLLSKEARTVIVGCDKYGSEIIEQALLVNVDDILGHREYHIFGNVKDFRIIHSELEVCFGVNEFVEGKDDLYFYEDSPLNYKELLSEVDRIIICMDEDDDNLDLFNKICRYVSTSAQIFVREKSGITLDRDDVFFVGSNIDTLNFDVIIEDKLTAKAREMNELYLKNNPDTGKKWVDLTDFERRSNMAVADHMPTKIRILLGDDGVGVDEERLEKAREMYKKTKKEKSDWYRRLEHERWMRFHILNNWRFSDKCQTKDSINRLHSLIMPFDDLSYDDQAKDDYSWKIL